MSTALERELRIMREQLAVLWGERGAAGHPERAVRLRELAQVRSGSGGPAITRVGQLENDVGYVTAAGAAEAAPIQEVQAGSNVTIDATDPVRPIINAATGAVESVNGQTGVVVLEGIAYYHGPGLPTGGTYTNGDRAFNTTNSREYTYVDGTWLSFGGGGESGMTLIAEVMVAAARTDIDFTGLDLDADRTYQIQLLMVPSVTGNQNASIFFNGDTADANYRRRRLTSFATTSVTGVAGNDAVFVTGTGGSNGAVIQPQKTMLQISKVAGVYPMVDARSVGWSGVGQLWIDSIGVSRMNAENVTSIKLRHNITNGFGVGSFARLYRLKG